MGIEMRKTTLHLTVAAVLTLASSAVLADRDSRPADQTSSEVASTWFERLYDVVKAESTAPPPASRIYGVTAIALYESIVAGTKRNRSLAGQLNGLTSVPQPDENRRYHWPTVANTVLASTIRGLYPAMSEASLTAIKDLEQSFASRQQAAVPRRQYERSVAHGQAVAGAILEWASTDGVVTYNNCSYVPVPVPGAWRPTPPLANPNPLLPCWGLIRPMILTSGEECRPPGHPPFSTAPASRFRDASLEVYKTGLNLRGERKTIADYWSDASGVTGTPAGHWIAIVSQIARRDNLSLAQAAEAYARVGTAVHDAFIVCWRAKYVFNLQRPVTYINDNIDKSWMPYLVTPGFPSYPSGHSTQSGAAARALTDMFGIKRFRDTTHVDHGQLPTLEPRRFDSFADAASEAAVSRLYGGIHFSFDNDDGLASGQCIGRAIRERVSFRDDEGGSSQRQGRKADVDRSTFDARQD